MKSAKNYSKDLKELRPKLRIKRRPILANVKQVFDVLRMSFRCILQCRSS